MKVTKDKETFISYVQLNDGDRYKLPAIELEYGTNNLIVAFGFDNRYMGKKMVIKSKFYFQAEIMGWANLTLPEGMYAKLIGNLYLNRWDIEQFPNPLLIHTRHKGLLDLEQSKFIIEFL